uniref:Uncharacterized protein n=1 Tax=Lotharella globosa TaxID=91324 RepID=A0A7S3Z1J2_9EUKA
MGDDAGVHPAYKILYSDEFRAFSDYLLVAAFLVSGLMLLLHRYHFTFRDRAEMGEVVGTVKSLFKNLVLLTGLIVLVGSPFAIASVFVRENENKTHCEALRVVGAAYFSIQSLFFYRVLLAKANLVGAMSETARVMKRATWIFIHAVFIPVVLATIGTIFSTETEFVMIDGKKLCVAKMTNKLMFNWIILAVNTLIGILCLTLLLIPLAAKQRDRGVTTTVHRNAIYASVAILSTSSTYIIDNILNPVPRYMDM